MKGGRILAGAAERAALLALVREHSGTSGWSQSLVALMETGSAQEAWRRLTTPNLFQVHDGDAWPEPWRRASRELADWDDRGLDVRTYVDPGYPAQVREVHQAPPLLFVRGEVLSSDPSVAVVGSRSASERGLALAGELAELLVADGRSVVAGLAAGIDAAAHEAALAAGGRTVAVLGAGLAARTSPAAHADLQRRIGDHGLLISQFWPDEPARRHTFLQRNATISGYSAAVVIVEAGERSGSRAQARLAVEQGRPLVLLQGVLANTWARELARRPGVQVVGSAEEARSAVVEATADPPELLDPVAVAAG